MFFIQDSDRVRADHLLQCQLHGRLQVHMLVHLRIFDQLNQHLGVRIGLERVPFLHQSAFEHRVVLDDTVMDDRQTLALRVVRVCIDGVRLAVRRPAGVRDTDTTVRVFVHRERFQFCHLPFRLVDVQLSLLVDQRHAGTVIPAVLQTMQTLYQDRIRLPFTYISYYSTHNNFSL